MGLTLPCAWSDTLHTVQNPDHLEPFLWKLQTVYFFTPTNDKYQWKKTVVISTHFCLELCLVLTLSSNFAWALIDMKRDAVMCLKTQVKQPQKVFQISLTIFLRRFMNEFISTYTTFSRSCVSIRMLNTSYSFTSDARSTIGTHQRELKALKRALLLKGWLHGKISSRQTGLEKSRLNEIFHDGLKQKSEVNPDRNFSVASVVLVIYIFPRLSMTFSARAESFSPDYMGLFSAVDRAEVLIQAGTSFM